MCTRNSEGANPNCIEAQFDGPGAEEYGLCYQCANVLNETKNSWKQQAWNSSAVTNALRTAIGACDWSHGKVQAPEVHRQLFEALDLAPMQVEKQIKIITKISDLIVKAMGYVNQGLGHGHYELRLKDEDILQLVQDVLDLDAVKKEGP